MKKLVKVLSQRIIITIIILLILAVVAIRAVTGKGILQYAKNSVDKHQEGVEKEEGVLGNYLAKLEERNEKEKLSGLYKIDGEYIPWSELLEDEILIVTDGALKCNDASIAGELIIDNTVTSLQMMAFMNCANLTGITIPGSIKELGKGLMEFIGCTGLEELVILNGVENIGNRTFQALTSLTNIKIPSSVMIIGDAAFYNCTALTSVEIPSSVTNIGGFAFSGCELLSDIIIPKDVKYIGIDAFLDTPWLKEERKKYLNSLVIINNNIVDTREVKDEVIIPEGVIEIPSCAFGVNGLGMSANTKITSVILPKSVEKLGNSAFWQCNSLESITIQKGLNEIESNAFDMCTALTTVNYTGTEEEWSKITIASNNDPLTSLTPNYNYVIE